MNRRFLILCMAVFVALPGLLSGQTLPAGGSAATAPATRPAEQQVPEEARTAIAEERYAEAIRILEPLADAPSPGFDVLVNLAGAFDAMALRAARDQDPAARERFREYGRKAVENYLRAAGVALEKGDPRTESLLQRVLRYDPRNARALAFLAGFTRQTSPTRAIHYYQEYIDTPEGQADPEAQMEYGRLLVSQNYWRQAISVLEKVRVAGGAEADRQLALAYLAGQQADKALEAVNRAINRDSNAPDSYLIRASLSLSIDQPGHLLRALEDLSRAVDLAKEAVAANPEDADQWSKLQLIFDNGTKIVQGIMGQARAGQVDPAVHLNVAQVLSGLGDLSQRLYAYQAVIVLRDATSGEDASVELLVALAQRQRDLGQADAAVKTAERILVKSPGNVQAKLIKENGGKPGPQ